MTVQIATADDASRARNPTKDGIDGLSRNTRANIIGVSHIARAAAVSLNSLISGKYFTRLYTAVLQSLIIGLSIMELHHIQIKYIRERLDILVLLYLH